MDYCLEIFIFICYIATANSLPIPSHHNIGDQKALLFGVLAFISVGAFLGACVCCRRRKRGFELNHVKDRKEFENESAGLEAARTEYPIFRAISSPERSNPQNDSIIQVANAHIIGINENNIQIDEEVDNNNGPLSPADMENIENNNAVDYIPNRNEIERLIEPVTISLEQEQQQPPLFDRSNPFNERISHFAYDVTVANQNNPFVNISSGNLIVVDDGNQNHEDALIIESDCQVKSSIKLLEEAVSMESSLSEKSVTDVNSVEEALRALDFAISGEESLLQPNDDDFECIENEGVSISCSILNDFLISNDAADAGYDTANLDEVNVEDIRREAELLVNSVIEECEHRIQETNKQIERFEGDELQTKTNDGGLSQKPINMNLIDYQVTIGDNCNERFFRNGTNDVNRTINLGENNKSSNEVESETTQYFDCVTGGKENRIASTTSDEVNLTKEFQSCSSIENLCFDNIVLEASTPFHKSNVGKMKRLFSNDSRPPSIDSPQASRTFDNQFDDSEVFESPTINVVKQVDETFVCSPLEPLINAGELNSTFTKVADGTFVKEPEIEPEVKIQLDCPIIKIDKEDSTSVDMTTVTPVNTPIELNYCLDSWDKFISNSMMQQVIMPKHMMEMEPCTSAQAALAEADSSGWFLHPKADGVADVNDTFDVEEESEENMNSTFDALRKQLAIMLPHAQGVTEHSHDFSDDDDDDTDEKVEQQSPTENNIETHTEMVINYKRPLSPILEESEDETCKTFVMNETKNLDSTSTGCVETGEAIMGVTKTLMASNDTLFNFEDTLGDDVFSPRANSQNDITKDSKMIHPDSSGASTPTPRSFQPMEFESIEISNVNDLLSPDQQKTLSEDICTAEHLSSDAVDTTFTTNTLDEKTCISVYIKEDEKISETSEPDWGSSNQCDLNSLNDIPSMGVLDNDDEQTECNDVENDESSSTVSTPKNDEKNDEKNDDDDSNVGIMQSNHRNDDDDDSYKDKTSDFLRNEINYSSSHFNILSSELGQPVIYDNIKENTDPNTTRQYDGMEAPMNMDKATIFHAKNLSESGIFEGDLLCENDVIMRNHTFHPDDITIDLNKHQSIIPNFTLCEIDTQGEQNCVMVATEIINHLSGEEDPWAHPMSDIRFTGSCAEIMTTSFTANEWDSDVDDSNSSEEFMYVKGTPPKVPSPELYKQKLENKHDKSSLVPIVVEEDIESVWNSHEDKVPVSVTEIVELNLEQSEDSSSDAEGEWVPSCWDSLAQPSRSALKSPDKSSSSPKKQRSVAFKKQNYHSVYEYPKEVVALSPSYSEPQLWARDLNDLFDKNLEPVEIKVTETDGFNVSSSTRPFHGSQFNAQCHTWPTDSNFSWSQIQDNEEKYSSNNDKYPSYSELQIKWPKDLRDFFCSEETQDNIDIEFTRPDSGVGESAELLSDSITLGDLCHTKASLRLPLNNVPAISTGETKKITDLLEDQSSDDMVDHNNLILPTPSCTGSMDSLSSSSGSERQISFSTFGKSISLDDDRINESDGKSKSDTNDDKQQDNECPINKLNHERSTKQSDSTDEDSGIESIMRIASEKI